MLTPVFLSDLSPKPSTLLIQVEWQPTRQKKPGWLNQLFGKHVDVDLDLHCFLFDQVGVHLETVNYRNVRSEYNAIAYSGNMPNHHDDSSRQSDMPKALCEKIFISPKRLNDHVHFAVIVATTFHGHSLNLLKNVSVSVGTSANQKPLFATDLVSDGNIIDDSERAQNNKNISFDSSAIKACQFCQIKRNKDVNGRDDWFLSNSLRYFSEHQPQYIRSLIQTVITP